MTFTGHKQGASHSVGNAGLVVRPSSSTRPWARDYKTVWVYSIVVYVSYYCKLCGEWTYAPGCQANYHLHVSRNQDVLTYICSSFGNREVGADTPGSSVIMPLTAAAVWPCGVVFTLTAQLSLVKHTAVGVQVALAPETERGQRCAEVSFWSHWISTTQALALLWPFICVFWTFWQC